MRNWRDLTEEEMQELARLYPTTFNRDLQSMFGISREAISKVLAPRYGWKKDRKGANWNRWNTRKRELTEEELKWFCDHYKHTRNSEIIDRLGIGDSTLHRLARRYGLKKTPQFMRKMQMEVSLEAAKTIIDYNLMPKGQRPAGLCYSRTGISNEEYFGKKRWKEIKAKAEETRRETVRKERMRIKWGLPQKTKIKFNEAARVQAMHRYTFKKRGYIVFRGNSHVYFDENTRRSRTMEKNARNYCLVVEPYSSYLDEQA